MKKIIYSLTLIMILISCATKKQMISSTTTKTDIITDSASEKKKFQRICKSNGSMMVKKLPELQTLPESQNG